ncbi:MAG: hypothetical protein JWM80_3341 [Cyanobacteria bacterium RYN_339]|nr:hypothetical protein [Cyanobacteria bacterium RYN_339]
MTLFSTRLASFMVALACLGCVAGQPTAPSAPTATPAAASQQAKLAGRVTLPILALSSGGIIPTGIGAVIAAGGGDLPSKQRQLLLLASAFDERPVSGATVVALDVATLAPLPGVAAVRTDAAGTYSLDVPPADGNVLVEAIFRSPDGTRGFRLLTAVRPGAAGNLSWTSTAAVGSLFDAAGKARAELATADVAALQANVLARVSGRPAAELNTLYTATLGVDPAAVTAGAAVGLVGSPPPDPAAPSAPASPGAAAPIASALPAVAGVVAPIASVLPAATTVPHAVTSVVQNVVQAPLPLVAPLPLPLPSVRLL